MKALMTWLVAVMLVASSVGSALAQGIVTVPSETPSVAVVPPQGNAQVQKCIEEFNACVARIDPNVQYFTDPYKECERGLEACLEGSGARPPATCEPLCKREREECLSAEIGPGGRALLELNCNRGYYDCMYEDCPQGLGQGRPPVGVPVEDPYGACVSKCKTEQYDEKKYGACLERAYASCEVGRFETASPVESAVLEDGRSVSLSCLQEAMKECQEPVVSCVKSCQAKHPRPMPKPYVYIPQQGCEKECASIRAYCNDDRNFPPGERDKMVKACAEKTKMCYAQCQPPLSKPKEKSIAVPPGVMVLDLDFFKSAATSLVPESEMKVMFLINKERVEGSLGLFGYNQEKGSGTWLIGSEQVVLEDRRDVSEAWVAERWTPVRLGSHMVYAQSGGTTGWTTDPATGERRGTVLIELRKSLDDLKSGGAGGGGGGVGVPLEPYPGNQACYQECKERYQKSEECARGLDNDQCEVLINSCIAKCGGFVWDPLPVVPGVFCPQGCVVDGKQCLPFGARFITSEKTPGFCGYDAQVAKQKAENEPAQNNFECLSNRQSNGKCVDDVSLLGRIVKALSRLFRL